MPKTFCVVGHDARQQAAARVLRRAGYGVTAADNAAAADYILLPMSQGRVSDEVARALQGAGQGTLILAGRPGMPVRMAAREAGLPLIDYFLRPELECLNAVPTAEGCLELLLRLRERTIWESGFLVLGYGRVGRAVARRLVLLGGRVTVAARSPEQRANARCAGCRAAPLTALPTLLPDFDAVINTVPAPVLPRTLLQQLPGGALIIDLASLPGGTDFAAAEELGLHAEHALALPGRCAPQTAGALIAQTVLAILEERDPDERSTAP
uniref:NAD(P)-dependent oxidoreductase n=1 Tax=Gemmiger formicilis TaxID=745368 RepID=UPI004028AF93